MPFRITTKNVWQFNSRAEDGERLIQRKKNSEGRADGSIRELGPMTQPKANGKKMFFSFDYAIKEMVNVAAVQPWSY